MNEESTDRVVADLTAAGLDQGLEKKRFFDLADRLAQSVDQKEQQQLKEELAILTFGAASLAEDIERTQSLIEEIQG